MGREVSVACILAVFLLVMLAASRKNTPVVGYWLSSDGTLHEIVATQEDNIRILGGSANGVDTKLRRGKIAAGTAVGKVRYGGRQIVWSDGKVWVRQGVS